MSTTKFKVDDLDVSMYDVGSYFSCTIRCNEKFICYTSEYELAYMAHVNVIEDAETGNIIRREFRGGYIHDGDDEDKEWALRISCFIKALKLLGLIRHNKIMIDLDDDENYINTFLGQTVKLFTLKFLNIYYKSIHQKNSVDISHEIQKLKDLLYGSHENIDWINCREEFEQSYFGCTPTLTFESPK